MTIDRILSIIATSIAFVAVPASGYLSYHYAIRGEKRKEWNLLAIPIREKLITQIDAISRGEYFYADISREDILKFGDLNPSRVRASLLSAFEEFERSHSFEELWETSSGRKMVTGDTSKALSASKNLLKFIDRK